VFPRRTPFAVMKENVRTVSKGVEPSEANQLFPAPSGPDGQSVFRISLNPESVDDGAPSTSMFCSGMGTNDEEKGEAPGEKGTLGLLVPFNAAFPVPKPVTKEPEKKRLASDELVVMEVTSAWAPDIPPNGALDHPEVLGSYIAMDEPGDEKLPPAHNLFSFASQYNALIWPLGPFDPTREKEPDAGV